MNLSPIARGVNALCHQLASAQPPRQEPVLYYTAPLPAPRNWWAGVRIIENAGKPKPKWLGAFTGKGGPIQLPSEPPRVGIDWGEGDDLGGWWAKIGGNPPTFWPHTIEQKVLEEVFGHAQEISEGAVRTWFDEADQRFRSERVEMRGTTTASTAAPEADLDLVKHYLRLADVLRHLPDAEPAQPVRMTREEYIRFTAQCDVYRASGRRAGLSTLAGLSIEIIPGT